jgi:hypothetical protein
MDRHSDNEQTDSASNDGLAATEKHLKTLLAGSVSGRIAPIELASGLDEESKL